MQTFTELCLAVVALAIAISAIVEVRSSVSPVARPPATALDRMLATARQEITANQASSRIMDLAEAA